MTDAMVLGLVAALIMALAAVVVWQIEKNHRAERQALEKSAQDALNAASERLNRLSSENTQLKAKIAENAKKAAQEARHIKNLNNELSKTKAQLKRAQNALHPPSGKQKTDSA